MVSVSTLDSRLSSPHWPEALCCVLEKGTLTLPVLLHTGVQMYISELFGQPDKILRGKLQ